MFCLSSLSSQCSWSFYFTLKCTSKTSGTFFFQSVKQLSTAIRELEPFCKYFYFLNSIPNFCLPAALSEPNIRVSEHFIISAVPSYSSNPVKKEDGLACVSQMASWDTEAYGGCLYPVTEVHERRAADTFGPSRQGFPASAGVPQQPGGSPVGATQNHSRRGCEWFRPERPGHVTDLGAGLELQGRVKQERLLYEVNILFLKCSNVYCPLLLHVVCITLFSGDIGSSEGNKNAYPSRSNNNFFQALVPDLLAVSSLGNEQQVFFFCLFTSRNDRQWTVQLF